MTPILLDLAEQLLSLALICTGTIAVLVVVEMAREATRAFRADWNEQRACGRIGHDQIVGQVERITEAQLQERRR